MSKQNINFSLSRLVLLNQNSIKDQRGIRQGCPVSALLYILVSEILAIKIKENNNIQGFSLPNMLSEIKSVQHADDLTMILKNIESLIHGIETIKSFCLHAGSKINISKTECILLGRLKGTFDNIDGIKVNTSSIKCLVYILDTIKKNVITKTG